MEAVRAQLLYICMLREIIIQYGVDILILAPLQIEAQLDLCRLYVEVVCLKETAVKMLIKHQLLYFIQHFVVKYLLYECHETFMLLL